MVISASRRTDVPAFYFDWFLRSLEQGFAEVPHPFNPSQNRIIPLTPEGVDAIVFWTKDPSRLLSPYPILDSYPWMALVTLTPYGSDWEPGFPNKELLVQRFQALSERIGKDRVIWRYDPIILTEKTPIEWHKTAFQQMSKRLSGYTSRCVVSFVSPYRKNRKWLRQVGWKEGDPAERGSLLAELREMAREEEMELQTCADPDSRWPGACIDGQRLSTIAGKELDLQKDPHQRPLCGCAKSVDIGTYGTCKGGCLYCYAT